MVRFINFLLYQVGWFACVLGAAYARPWLGVGIALVLVATHLYLATDRLGQVKIMTLAALVGLLVDSTLLMLGVFTFPTGVVVSGLPPAWMSVLWMQFATTFGYCFYWLSRRYVLCALLGLVVAPIVFLGGENLGAVTFLTPRIPHLILLGIVWSAAIPLLVYVADRIQSAADVPIGYRGFSA